MSDSFTYILIPIASFIAYQVWLMNGKLASKDVTDSRQNKDIENLRERAHKHANTLHGHEGRLTNLENKE